MKFSTVFLMVAPLIANAAPAHAQCDPAAPQAVSGAPQPPKSGDIKITGSLRARAYSWDWFTPTSGNNDYQYPGNIFRLNLCTIRHNAEWTVEFAVPFIFALPTNAVGTGPQQGALGFGSNYFSANNGRRNVAMIFPDQLYAKFKVAGDKDNTLQLGRFTFLDGTEITPQNDTLATLKRDASLNGSSGISDFQTSAGVLTVCITHTLHPNPGTLLLLQVSQRAVSSRSMVEDGTEPASLMQLTRVTGGQDITLRIVECS